MNEHAEDAPDPALAESVPARSPARRGYFRRRLNALVLAVALPLVIVQIAQFVRDQRIAGRDAMAGLSTRVDVVAGNLNNILGRAEGLLEFLSRRENLRGIDETGCNALLGGVAQVDPMYTNVLLIDKTGTLVCGSTGRQFTNYATTPWFVQGMQAPRFRLADPIIGRITGKNVALLTLTVLDGHGDKVALLGVAFDLRALSNALGADGALPDEVISVIKDQDVYLLRSLEPDRYIGQKIRPSLRERLRVAAGDSPDVATAADGVERAFASASIPQYNLKVLVGQPKAVLYAAARQTPGWRVAGPVVVISLGLLAAWLGARNLARPLQKIADAARAIAAGDVSVRVDRRLPGEFGEVAAEFNRLMDLQQRAADRLRRSEQHALRMSNFYQALSNTNQLVGHPHEETHLFDEVCRICVATKLAERAWIGLLEGSVLRRVAWSGAASRVGAETAGSMIAAAPPAADGPVARTIASGQPCAAGCAAAFPVSSGGTVVGVLGLDASQPDYFDIELMSLLADMVHDVSHGLEAHRHRAEREALREVAAANDARSTFFTQVSHELRTPLNAILGFTQLLHDESRGQLSPRGRVQLDNVHLASSQLRALIDDVLDLSRVDAGLMALEPRDVDLAELLAGVATLCEPLAQRQAVTTRCVPDVATPARAWLDPIRLRQIMLNLMTNAIKYNRPGGSARLSVARVADALRIEVSDTGMGMSPLQMDKLFQPFNRLGREAMTIEGSGIGLNLTRQLVALMGGSLELRSKENVGTRAIVLLPFVEPVTPPPSVNAPDTAPAATSAPAQPRGRVLYIEDNPVNSLLVEQLLSRWKDVVLVGAESGAEGLRRARDFQPHIVLLDMNLPDMDGLEVLARLHADPPTRAADVIFLSASASQDEVRAALAAGASDFWPKPIDFAQVLDGLEAALTRLA